MPPRFEEGSIKRGDDVEVVNVGEDEEMVVLGEELLRLWSVDVVAVDSLRLEDRDDVSELLRFCC